MVVRPEKVRTSQTYGAITKSCSLGSAGNDTYVLSHSLILQATGSLDQ